MALPPQEQAGGDEPKPKDPKQEQQAGAPFAQGSSFRENIEQLIQQRQEEIGGQFLEAAPPKEVQVGSQKVTLSGDVPNWTQLVRINEQFSASPRAQHLSNYEQLNPAEQTFFGKTIPGTIENFERITQNIDREVSQTAKLAGLDMMPEQVKSGRKLLAIGGGALLGTLLAPGAGTLAGGVAGGLLAETERGRGLTASAMDFLEAVDRRKNQILGYAYQSKFDERLRDWDSIDFLLTNRDKWEWQPSDPRLSDQDALALAAFQAGEFLPLVIAPETPFSRGGEEGQTLLEWMEGNKEVSEDQIEWLSQVWEGDYVDQVGGLPELIEMRRKILNGADPDQVRAEYAEQQGWLYARSQFFQLIFDVIVDPLDMALTLVAPVSRLHAIRQVTLFKRVAPEITKTADTLSDAREVFRTTEGAADVIGDVARGGQVSEDLVEQASAARRMLNSLDELERVGTRMGNDTISGAAQAARRAIDEGEDVAEALKPVDELIQRFQDLEPMTYPERFVLWASGGDPFQKAPTDGFRGFVRKMNPLALTPGSRAKEFIDTMWTNLSSMFSRADNVDDMVATFKRVAEGAFGSRFGHMMVSPVGRYTQDVLKASAAAIDELHIAWQMTTEQRRIMQRVARVLDKSVPEVVARVQRGGDEAQALFDSLVDTLRGLEQPDLIAQDLLRMLEEGTLSAERMAEIGVLFKQTPTKIVPYTQDMFRAGALKAMVESAAEFGIKHFGVEQGKWWSRARDYVKSAESLLLLGMNPFYPVMNMFNNEVTSIARGVWGLMLPGSVARRVPLVNRFIPTIDEVWDALGVRAPRLTEGFGVAGPNPFEEIAKADDLESWALSSGREVLRQAEMATPGRIGQKFLDVVSRGQDFRAVSARLERLAAERATTMGMLKAWRRMWRPTKLNDYKAGLLEEIRAVDPDFADTISDAVRSARKIEDIEDIVRNGNLQWNLENLLTRTARNMNLEPDDLEDFVGPEVFEAARKTLAQLGPNADPEEVRLAFDTIKDFMQAHLDEAVNAELPIRTAEVASRVEAEGAAGVVNVYGDVAGRLHSRFMSHAKKLDMRVSQINEIDDPALRGRMWDALFDETDNDWGPTWDFFESNMRGIRQGLKKRGFDRGDELLDSFKALRKTNQEFFDLRRKLWSGFKDEMAELDDAARIQRTAEIYDQLDTEYLKLIDVTDNAWAQMDDVFIGMMNEGDPLRQPVMEWRTIVREMRRRDMEDVFDAQRTARTMRRQEKSEFWRQVWTERNARTAQIEQLEELGQRMIHGEGDALRFFQFNRMARMERMGPFADLFQAETAEDALRGFENVLGDAAEVHFVPAEEFRENILARVRWQDWIREGAEGPIAIEFSESLFDADMATVRNAIVEEFAHVWQTTPEALEEVGRFIGAALPTDETRRIEFLLANRDEFEKMAQQIARFFTEPATLRAEDAQLYEQIRSMAARHEELNFLGQVVRNMPAARFADARRAPTIPFDRVVKRQPYYGTGIKELWFDWGSDIVDDMREQAVQMLDEPSKRFSQMPERVQRDLRGYLDRVIGDMGDSKAAAIRVAEGYRDSALLNYNRRYNADAWASYVFPFHFWFTHSMFRWAIHSIDRPWMLATYARANLYMEQAIGERSNFPSRLRNHVQFNMPFVPEEFGGAWVDPSRVMGLPFGTFDYAFERWNDHTTSVERATEKQLEQMLEAGSITRSQFREAMSAQGGDVWDRARDLAQQQDGDLRFDLLDFMNATTSPHLPITVAWNLQRGTPEEITPLPATRFAKNVLDFVATNQSMQGVADTLGIDVGTYDRLWGNVRKAMGLEAFDKWQDYRVWRELSNMAGEGMISGEDAIRAMVEGGDNQWYMEAKERVARVEATQFGYRFFGIPIKPYPEGEEHQRELYDAFFHALDMRDKGDTQAVHDFFEANPEFESRLALWDEPEERHRRFTVDQIWSIWNDLPSAHKRTISDHLGPEFQELFLDKETRSYDSLPPEQLDAWLQIMGGDPPGKVTWDENIAPLDLLDSRQAHRLQVFYDTRSQAFNYFERVSPLWEDYFKLQEGQARREFWDQNPILQTYVDWRTDFMLRNPDLMRYIEDDPDSQPKFESIEALQEAQRTQPNFTYREWQTTLGVSTTNLVLDQLIDNEPMPPAALERLREVADRLGITVEEITVDVATAARNEGIADFEEFIDVPELDRSFEQAPVP